jgi:kinesin family protein C1
LRPFQKPVSAGHLQAQNLFLNPEKNNLNKNLSKNSNINNNDKFKEQIKPKSHSLNKHDVVSSTLKDSQETSKIIKDFNLCKGNIFGLRDTLRTQKRNESSLNNLNILNSKKDGHEFNEFIARTNSYINNICRNLTEKYRRSSLESTQNISVGKVNCPEIEESASEIIFNNSKISSQKDASEAENSAKKNKSAVEIKDYITLSNESQSKRRFSLPNFNTYSTTLNNHSTASGEDLSTCENREKDINLLNVNNFSLHYENTTENNSPEICQNNALPVLNLEQIENINIINEKLKEKERYIDYEIQNFDLILENNSKEKIDPKEIIREFEERENKLIEKMLNLERMIKNKTNENLSLNNSINELMTELDKGEVHRRKLHNYIQELRGNIRVYCRVKPKGDMNYSESVVKYPEMSLKSCQDRHIFTIELNNSIFHFDKVFTESSSQFEIFKEIKPFIQSALDGENVAIFAYGATNSGKTYTMNGPHYNSSLALSEESGILPRAAFHIFEEVTRLQKLNVKFKISISAIEIYNENIYDLFSTREQERASLNIVTSQQNKLQMFVVKGVIWNEIKSKEDIINLTHLASSTRRTDSTQFNESSSRSHAIFQLKIEQINSSHNNQTTLRESYINIIDLAGSEKCMITTMKDKNKDEIELMKKIQNESNFINKSLTTLGRIVMMLADKKSNKMSIPYRESKLTMILQNSLKVSSKTAMIVTICSDHISLNQSKESLKFAQNAMIAC